MEFYQQTATETLKRLETSETGLVQSEADFRLRQYGPNELDIKGESWWHKLTEPFRSIFMLILGAAATISFMTGERLDALIILSIIVVSAVIYYAQRVSTERILSALKRHDSHTTEVLRNGSRLKLAAEELVPGDIIRLYEGERIPADARAIHTKNVRVDESLLTGESMPVTKHNRPLKDEKPVYERTNMLFKGSFLVSGEVSAMITATGNATEFGRLAALSQQTNLSSPVKEKIDKLISQIVAGVACLSAVVFALSIYRDIALPEALRFMLTLAVAAIPEGLPVAITVVLVLGMRRMAKRQALVRNMAAIENIGIVTTIATDKTGTLTKNQLKVQDVWHLLPQVDLKETANQVFLSANRKHGDTHDPLDTAFCDFTDEYHGTAGDYEHIRSLPFELPIAMSGNVWKCAGGYYVYLKGAPERILSKSKLSTHDRHKAEQALHSLTGQGFRVIALARVPGRSINELTELESDKFEFLALLAVADEIRSEAGPSIEAAKAAGVTVRMITGDHFETAFSVGKQLGLVRSREQVFDSRNMETMNDEELSQTIENARVFSRVIPEHKHRILSILKRQDITAMTGDGVNDVPALTNAHVGLSMGSGSQIAKDAGDIVLLDDNFQSVVAALAEGRKIFDNIKRMLFYLLTTNVGEALTIVSALLIGLPLPVLPAQILWMNLATDTSLVIPLGLEPAEKDVMRRKPRKPKQPLFDKITVIRMLLIAGIMAVIALTVFIYFLRFETTEYARTLAFSTLVVMQWARAFTARSEWESIFTRMKIHNRVFYLGLGVAVLLQVIAFGPLQEVLSLADISTVHLLIVNTVSATIILLADELFKYAWRRAHPHKKHSGAA